MGKILTLVVAVLVILVGSAYLVTKSEPELENDSAIIEEEAEAGTPVTGPIERREIPPPEPEVIENYALSGELPSLDQSDEALFNHLRLLITPIRLGLLNEDQFIRKFVLQVDNASRGELIYQHSPLVAPESGIEVAEGTETEFQIDQQGYARYDAYADLAEAVNTSLLVAYYQFYEPLLDEAYTELGYPEGQFRTALIQAIDQVLATPIVEGDIALDQPELNYLFNDSALESLNMLQKQMLRMGPENTQRIQLVLQQFKARIQ